jgi:NAD(P)-dependent dehydrogenase (short-subunit alcohol dehydrogenase family)
MGTRLAGKVAMIVGAGQSPGETMGNGRATALLFAREGAKVLAVDRDPASAAETVRLIAAEGGVAEAFEADVTSETQLAAAVARATSRWGRLDVLHNNVGISVAGGDASPTEITEAAFDRIMTVNLRGVVMACKHALPVMRAQQGGAIVNISSLAAVDDYPWVTYKASKAAMIAYTRQLAIQNAQYGIRANAILPGLMDTPMAVDTRARAWGKTREAIAAERDARVPLRQRMGTAWDVAHAALFLASDEAGFVTGAALPVDGGASCRIG